MCVCVFVVINFDALAGASDFLIDRGQVVFFPLNAGFEAGNSETPNRQETECPLPNRLSYGGSIKNLNLTARSSDIYTLYI